MTPRACCATDWNPVSAALTDTDGSEGYASPWRDQTRQIAAAVGRSAFRAETCRAEATGSADMTRHLVKRANILFLGVLLLILALVAGISLERLNAARDAREWAQHSYRVLGTLKDLVIALTEAETGQRGYVLTGKDEYLAPYNAARDRIGLGRGARLLGRQGFAQGRAAMYWHGTYAIPAIRSYNSDINLGTFATPAEAGLGAATVLGVGLGAEESVTPEAVRRAAGVAARALEGVAAAATTLSSIDLAAAVEGAILGAYRFAEFRTTSAPKKATLGALALLTVPLPVTLAVTAAALLRSLAVVVVPDGEAAKTAEVVEAYDAAN